MSGDNRDEQKNDGGGASYIYGTVEELRTLLSGGWKDVDSAFLVEELDAHLARVRISKNPDGSDSFELELLGSEGTGDSPHLDVNMQTVDFGAVAVRHVKDVAIVITNNGSKTIEITKIAKIGADSQSFSISGIGTPFQVLPGLKVQINLHFMPDRTGQFAAALHIESGAGNDSNLVITMAGIGISDAAVENGDTEESVLIAIEPNPVKVSEPIYYNYSGEKDIQSGIVVYDAFARELYSRYRVDIHPGVNPLPVPLELDGGKYAVRFIFPHTQRIVSFVVEGKKKRPRGRPPKKR